MPIIYRDLGRDIDHLAPAAARAQLGSAVADLLTATADLQVKFAALLAKLDTAGIAGGTNASLVGLTAATVTPLGSRPQKP